MRRFVTPRAAVAVAICLVGAGLAGSASAQELGLIYAVVLDQTGQPLTDLTPEEFQVSEDGNAAEVVSAQVGAEPMKIAPDGPGVEEVVADKGYHSDETLVALGAVGVRSHVSEPERGRRCWQDKKTGETPPEKRAAAEGVVCEPPACARASGSSPATLPGRGGGAYFRAPV